jgi:hypothetical protein
MKPTPPEYEAGVLTTRPLRSVSQFEYRREHRHFFIFPYRIVPSLLSRPGPCIRGLSQPFSCSHVSVYSRKQSKSTEHVFSSEAKYRGRKHRRPLHAFKRNMLIVLWDDKKGKRENSSNILLVALEKIKFINNMNLLWIDTSFLSLPFD